MKYLKRFLESVNSGKMSKEDILLLLDDVKSLDYILEEGGFKVRYEPIFKNENPRSSGRMRVLLSQIESFIGYDFLGFRIEIWVENPMRTGLGLYTSEQKEVLAKETERYCNLLREHLDYGDSKFKSVKCDYETPDFKTFKNIILVQV